MCATPTQLAHPDAPAADTASDAIGEPADDGEPSHYDDEPPSRPAPEVMPGPIALSVHCEDPDACPAAVACCGWLTDRLGVALDRLGIRRGSLEVVIVGDETMGQLHGQYKDDPGTTDVLTFDLREHQEEPMSEANPSIEAELVLCFDEAQRQAEHRGHEPKQELLLYAVHGLMHLLDEDDHDESAAARMHRREDDLLEQMGEGRV